MYVKSAGNHVHCYFVWHIFQLFIYYHQNQKSLVKFKTVEKITGIIILGCHPHNDFSSPHRSHNWRHNELLNLLALSLEFHVLDSPLGGGGGGGEGKKKSKWGGKKQKNTTIKKWEN